MHLPFLVFCDKNGRIYSHPFLRMSVSSLSILSLPSKEELIRLPKGSKFFYLLDRLPVGFNPHTKNFEVLKEFKGREVYAVGAFLIPGYLRFYNPAYYIKRKTKLPLWAYTAVGFYGGNFYVPAKRVDSRRRQSPQFYNDKEIRIKIKEFLKRYPNNRLYKHLSHCALNYNCLAAKNLFLKRWEAPLPTSRFCNASCLGCLSYQRENALVASHQRISFIPSLREVTEVMINHLKEAKESIVSFGQGCEGEPLLEAELIAKSIYLVRNKIWRGTINMNTNASMPSKIELLCKAGIDSFRISLNSVQEKYYKIYFKPFNYTFKDVVKSIEIAKKYKKFVSINLFIFPGFSDSEEEITALIKFIRTTGIDMIQWRNLNIDPDYYVDNLPCRDLKPKGVSYLIDTIKKEFPHLKTGYFNLPKEKFYL
jgi:pyruvate-formate lyase-activating enzyme